MKSSKPQEGAGKLKASKEILPIFIISDKNGSAPGKPSQCPLNHPATGWVFLVAVFIELLFANAPDMGNVACRFCCGMACGVVITFVEAQMLGSFRGRLRPSNDNGIQCLGQELSIMNITNSVIGRKRSLSRFHTTPQHRNDLRFP